MRIRRLWENRNIGLDAWLDFIGRIKLCAETDDAHVLTQRQPAQVDACGGAKEREFYNCPSIASILSGTERFLRSAVEGCGHDAMTTPPPSTPPAQKQRVPLRMLRYG